MKLEMLVSEKLGKAISESSNQEIYQALMAVVQDMAEQKESNAGKKKVYYVSAEFLIGKLLSNNMINLGIYEDVRKMLAANGKDICEIEEIEAEPSLGNGGLGRLAACFLDSIATLGYNVSVCMDITFIFPQKRFRIFPASSRLVLEVADGIYSISDAAVNPHIGIGRIFPSRFF